MMDVLGVLIPFKIAILPTLQANNKLYFLILISSQQSIIYSFPGPIHCPPPYIAPVLGSLTLHSVGLLFSNQTDNAPQNNFSSPFIGVYIFNELHLVTYITE